MQNSDRYSLNLQDEIGALQLIFNERKIHRSYDQIMMCIKEAEQIHNKSLNDILVNILSYIADTSLKENTIELMSVVLKYGMEQILISKALFHVFDIYKTSKFAKSEYSQHKSAQMHYGDIFKHLNINTRNYNYFMDICCNPGTFTLYMLDSNPHLSGVGLTLSPSAGGYTADKRLEHHNRFEIRYSDILEKDALKYKPPRVVDFAHTGCFIAHNAGKRDLTKNLYANSYLLSMKHMRKGGDMLVMLSFQWDYEILLDTTALLENMFQRIRLYKSPKFTAGLSHAYVFCTGYQGEINYPLFDKYIANEKLYTSETIVRYAKAINHIFMIMNKRHIQIIEHSKGQRPNPSASSRY